MNSGLTSLLQRRGFFALLALDIVAATIAVWSCFTSLTPASLAHSPMRTPTQDDETVAHSLLPFSNFQETLSRPVFQKSRRPYQLQPIPVLRPRQVSLEPAWDPRASLKGIVMTEGHKRVYIATGNDNRGDWISEGQKIQGWTLQSIRPNSATLAQGSDTFDLHLYAEKQLNR